MVELTRERPVVQREHEASPRCSVCGSPSAQYGCTVLICRGLDCD